MRVLLSCTLTGIVITAGALASTPVPKPAAPKGGTLTAPDFNAEVRPILANHCFKCHGPDDKKRMAGLRLDLRDAALAPAATGKRALVPGKPAASELIRRILMTEGGVMPPAHTKNPLTAAEKQILQRWVAAGGEYRPHWAFVAPKQTPLPAVKLKSWPRNPIDYFVLAKLEQEGLRPSPEADRYTLIRRVSLDLIGLPPTPEEAEAFVNDKSPNAYEKAVDRLLASPRYGERWARRWLDLARYADTNGYEKDRARSIWPYRDWVINALNADMPFNQFTVDQLAGDLEVNEELRKRGNGGASQNLDSPFTHLAPDLQNKLVATGFHRNTMLNEEGGIDPLEYRFHAMTDRVATTATTWLGMTVGCAQCHTHKFDPIPHREYYQFFAFLNNADEPELDVMQPGLAAKQSELLAVVEAREKDLVNRFPAESEYQWSTPAVVDTGTSSRALLQPQSDGSLLVSGSNPEQDTYRVTLEAGAGTYGALRLEAIPDASLGHNGPGRSPHGNFVLSEISVRVAPKEHPDLARVVKLTRAEADFSQDMFPAANAIDGNSTTGWAIHGPEPWNVKRTATFYFQEPINLTNGRWTVELAQQFGQQHTLGRFRLGLAQVSGDTRPLEARRKEHLERKFAAWQTQAAARAVRWTVLRPVSAKSNLPLLTVQPDNSVLSSGDQTKRDVYDIGLRTDLKGITAIRLEALPDDRLPKHGPGRIFYEGPFGDFHLSEVTLTAGGKPVKINRATQTFGTSAQTTLDGNPQTGWSINGGQGQAHSAVFNLAEPVDGQDLNFQLLFERYFAAGMGRFRISVTTDTRMAEAAFPAEVEKALLVPTAERTAAQSDQLLRYYLSIAPELNAEREEIKKLRAQVPQPPTTLVMMERPAENPRPTFLYNRGEFLQPTDKVEPGTLGVLHPLPKAAPRNRLTFARWLVDPKNPLVGRVTANRQWAAFFGQGIVRSLDDFGYQGAPPTHPELLDYLATVFVCGEWRGKSGEGNTVAVAPSVKPWSMKDLHRLIVTSATYRQSSRVTPALLAKDPQNRLLTRGPRFRMEAEMIRDTALMTSGLLTDKLGGPSVFPPQPPGVTSEGTYGALAWTPSTGEDRYRRGLYTFTKRTAPFAMTLTFDGPSGEACVARREISNTPLQALTLLNDTVFTEAAQSLGKLLAARPGSLEARVDYLFRRCLTRPPSPDEVTVLVRYYEAQKARLDQKELNAATLSGQTGDTANEVAAWMLVARSLLNLDEAVTKE